MKRIQELTPTLDEPSEEKTIDAESVWLRHADKTSAQIEPVWKRRWNVELKWARREEETTTA